MQLDALKKYPKRTNSSEFTGLNSFQPSEFVRSGAAKMALRPRPTRVYEVPPEPTTVVLGNAPDENMDRLKAQLARKDYEEVKGLRELSSTFHPANEFRQAESLRSSFARKVLTGDEYLLKVFVGASQGTDLNDSPLRLTYHVPGDETAKPFVPEGWLRPQEMIPLETSFNATNFYRDITLFTEEMIKDHVKFAQNLVFSDLSPVTPKFGNYNNEYFVATESSPCAWKEMVADAIANDIATEQQLKTLKFRESRKPFDINHRRRKLAAYFGKYGANKAKTDNFSYDIKEVVEAVSKAQHLEICAANRANEERIKDDLAALNTRELSEKAKAVYTTRYQRVAKRMNERLSPGMKLKNHFFLFIKTVAPAVTLDEHLAICKENAVKVAAMLAVREKHGAAVCDFPSEKEWKKVDWKIPERLLAKLTTKRDVDVENDDLNMSVDTDSKVIIEDALTPVRDVNAKESVCKASPTSIIMTPAN